jgi:hypothetical protein
MRPNSRRHRVARDESQPCHGQRRPDIASHMGSHVRTTWCRCVVARWDIAGRWRTSRDGPNRAFPRLRSVPSYGLKHPSSGQPKSFVCQCSYPHREVHKLCKAAAGRRMKRLRRLRDAYGTSPLAGHIVVVDRMPLLRQPRTRRIRTPGAERAALHALRRLRRGVQLRVHGVRLVRRGPPLHLEAIAIAVHRQQTVLSRLRAEIYR